MQQTNHDEYWLYFDTIGRHGRRFPRNSQIGSRFAPDGTYSFLLCGRIGWRCAGIEVPELHFEDADARMLHDRAFVARESAETLIPDIGRRAAQLKQPLARFLDDFRLTMSSSRMLLPFPCNCRWRRP